VNHDNDETIKKSFVEQASSLLPISNHRLEACATGIIKQLSVVEQASSLLPISNHRHYQTVICCGTGF
jgi:hypothetical protein